MILWFYDSVHVWQVFLCCIKFAELVWDKQSVRISVSRDKECLKLQETEMSTETLKAVLLLSEIFHMFCGNSFRTLIYWAISFKLTYVVLLIQTYISISNFSNLKYPTAAFIVFLNSENTVIQYMTRQLITNKRCFLSMSINAFLLDL